VVPIPPAQVQVASAGVLGQPPPQGERPGGPVFPLPGIVGPTVVSGQPPPQAPREVLPVIPAPRQVPPGVATGQPQPHAQGQVILGAVRVPENIAPAVVLSQPQLQGPALVSHVFLEQAPVVPAIALGQPQPLINQPQAQRHVAQAAYLIQGREIHAPQNAPLVAGSPQAQILLDTQLSSAGCSSGSSQQTLQQTV